MIKKNIVIVMTCFLLLTIGCTKNEKETLNKENYTLIESHKNYNIYEKEGNFKYYYTVNTPSGILYESEKLNNKPNVKEYENGVIEISISHGNTGLRKYFDVNNNFISQDYKDVFESNGNLCVYANPFNLMEIIVQDIFDKEEYYKTITFDFELRPTSIEKVEIDEKNLAIKVTYYDENDQLVEKNIKL